jgi:hypothetical protein
MRRSKSSTKPSKAKYIKMSLDKLKALLVDLESKLRNEAILYDKERADYNLTKLTYEQLINESNSIKEAAFNRLGYVKKKITNPKNPPLNQDEINRILIINKKLPTLGYKPNPLFSVYDFRLNSLRQQIGIIKSIVNDKEESKRIKDEKIMAKRLKREEEVNKNKTKREEDKVKRLNEKAIVAAAKGKTREAAIVIRRILKKQLTQNPNCPYCGNSLGKTPHCDHIYPISHGGRSTIGNMVYICNSCNLKKRDLTLREFINKCGLDRDMVEKRLLTLGKKKF